MDFDQLKDRFLLFFHVAQNGAEFPASTLKSEPL
jgi:hypothetical protein